MRISRLRWQGKGRRSFLEIDLNFVKTLINKNFIITLITAMWNRFVYVMYNFQMKFMIDYILTYSAAV